jgi:hypothetical protein
MSQAESETKQTLNYLLRKKTKTTTLNYLYQIKDYIYEASYSQKEYFFLKKKNICAQELTLDIYQL